MAQRHRNKVYLWTVLKLGRGQRRRRGPKCEKSLLCSLLSAGARARVARLIASTPECNAESIKRNHSTAGTGAHVHGHTLADTQSRWPWTQLLTLYLMVIFFDWQNKPEITRPPFPHHRFKLDEQKSSQVDWGDPLKAKLTVQNWPFSR